ncbi:MAG: hypothetical protein HON43_01645 [Alphaproteobacteria bacterium]|nr:hypothetical protein [Alphaproteobacteria bacterium]MBT5390614.1 hypothetical protein [Alphaproteobacteria bacterium]
MCSVFSPLVFRFLQWSRRDEVEEISSDEEEKDEESSDDESLDEDNKKEDDTEESETSSGCSIFSS